MSNETETRSNSSSAPRALGQTQSDASAPSTLCRGTVLMGVPELMVTTEAGPVEAEVAASCLLEPEPGDHVLLVQGGGGAFVLAVLRREGTGPAMVDVPEGLTIRSREGNVTLAGHAVELTASDKTTLTSPNLEVSSLRGTFFVDKLEALGSRIDADVGKLSIVAETIDTVADRLRQKLERSYRFVKGLDQKRAGTIDAKAETYARVHASNTVITSDNLVKIDGEQIHIG